jgi:membrane protein
MAELRDVPMVLRRMGPLTFGRKVYHEIGDDNLYTWAAALAYSWLFAVFPFFLVLLTLIPLLRQEWRKEAKDQINNAINQLPHDAKNTVHDYVDPKLDALLGFKRSTGITVAWSLGLLVTLWAASGGMAMTMASMDRCYDVERMRPFYKQRPLAVVLTMVVATLVLAVVILIPVGTLVTNYLTSSTEKLLQATNLSKSTEAADEDEAPEEAASTQPTTEPAAAAATTLPVARKMVEHPYKFTLWLWLWQVIRHGLALLFMIWLVALIYHFGPNVKQKFRLLTPGAVFTVAVWIALAFTFRIYVDRFGKYGQTYGAVGGVIILLFFFYLDALVLLVGAEINSEIDAAKRKWHHEQAKPPPPETTIDTKPALETP